MKNLLPLVLRVLVKIVLLGIILIIVQQAAQDARLQGVKIALNMVLIIVWDACMDTL